MLTLRQFVSDRLRSRGYRRHINLLDSDAQLLADYDDED